AGGGAPPAAPPPAAAGAGAGPSSDKRLKRNIQYLSILESGVRLYSFQYLWSDITYVGVMAQDLVYDYPEALSTDKNGFYKVNYAMLGLKMVTLEEWQIKHSVNIGTKTLY
ncbi:MAG: tail fiber domain-containing protein, partial [Patescibacteria group bacterium]